MARGLFDASEMEYIRFLTNCSHGFCFAESRLIALSCTEGKNE